MMRFVVALQLLVFACVDTGPGPQPRVDMKYARQHLLASPPKDIVPFDLALGGDKVIYLGNTLDRSRLVPGQALTIKHYWKVLKPIGRNWRPFALVRGPQGTADFMNLEPSDMQVAYPTAKWKANDIIEDEQTFTMRPDWSSPYAFLYVGLIEVGKHDTLDRMAVAPSARTNDRAIVAAKLEIDLARAPPPLGTIHVPRAAGPIVIDGLAINDPGWTNALTSPEFVTGEASTDAPGKATTKITYDDQFLYLFVSVVDPDITTAYANHDDPLWKADSVEIFIDADGNGAGYVELQVNPRNAVFDSWFAGPRAPSGDVTWSSNMLTKVNLRGTAAAGDNDQGWDVEIAIPWAAVKGRDEQMRINTPPRIGDRWRLNVNRVDVTSGNERQNVSSWNRIGNDWHALDKMLTAVFADPTGSTAPPAENAPTPGMGSGSGSGVGSGSGTGAPATGIGSGSDARTPATGIGSGSGTGGSARQPSSGSSAGSGTLSTGIGGSSLRQPAPASGSGSGVRQPASGTANTTPTAPTRERSGTGGGSVGGTGRGPASTANPGSGSSR